LINILALKMPLILMKD